MLTIIPGILVHSQQEFAARVGALRGHTTHVHVDIMDGKFVPNTTWADGAVIPKLLPDGMTYEAHCMMDDPLAAVRTHPRARRVIFHAESPQHLDAAVDHAREGGQEVYLALNPETPLSRIASFVTRIHGILLLGNTPGFSGKPLLIEQTVDRLRALAASYPHLARSVDIGVNDTSAHMLREAGATELIATSFLTGDIAEKIRMLSQ